MLLKEAIPERHEYHAVLSTISTYAHRLHNILQHEATRDLVMLNADRVLPRLEKMFEAMKTSDVPHDVPENIFQGIVFPLIESQSGILSLDQSVGLALPVFLKTPSPYLHQVAATLLRIDGLLERLASNGIYSAALKDWLSSSRNYLDDLQVRTITEKLLYVCDSCTADHDISIVSERWHKAKPLIDSLKFLLKSLQEDEKNILKTTRDLPRLVDMKVLAGNDKKENRARRDTQNEFRVPDDILEQMTSLGMSQPRSSRAISIFIEQLEKEIPSFMLAALESFPCRFCWEKLMGTLSTPAHVPIAPVTSTDIDIKYDIFGKRVGLWKVLMSDQVLNSSRKLARAGKHIVSRQSVMTIDQSGAFDLVEQRLRQLASGEWKGKDLSHRAGSKTQKQSMKVPILQTAITDELFLLWQVDVGFYEDLPWVPQHIVKGAYLSF